MMIGSSRLLQWWPLLVVLAMGAWALWLLSMAKTPLHYMNAQASERSPLPTCEWVRIDAPMLVRLGFSQEPSHAWTYRRVNTITFHVDPGLVTPVAELRVVGLAGKGVSVAADGGAPVSVAKPAVVRLPLRELSSGGIHRLDIEVIHNRAPRGADVRWMGVAVSALRVCGTAS